MILLVGLSFSCTEWNEFRKYTEDGEIVYPGKVQSLEILSGEERVQLIGTLGPDMRVTLIRVYWNDFADSLDIEVTGQVRASGFDQIVEVDEGLRTFVLHTFDEFGNKSLPVSEIGVSYGEVYRSKIQNRAISSTFATDTSTMIIWKPIDTSTGAKYVTVDYSVDDNALTVETPATADTTELIGLINSSTITYKMVYLPSADCIDLFYSETEDYEVIR